MIPLLIVVKGRMLEFYLDDNATFMHALALDVIQFFDGGNYFQSCQDKHRSMHVYCRSLSDSK